MGSGKGHIQHKGLLALRNKQLCLRSQFISEVTVERQFPPVVLVLLQVAILITGFRIIEIRAMAGQKPVERIEAFRIRTLGGFGAQMPFSDTARTVVIPFQQSRQEGHLPAYPGYIHIRSVVRSGPSASWIAKGCSPSPPHEHP